LLEERGSELGAVVAVACAQTVDDREGGWEDEEQGARVSNASTNRDDKQVT
jgi:hypothetical protein